MRLRLATAVFCVLLGTAGVVAATSPASASNAPPTSLKGWMLAEGSAKAFANAYGKAVPVQWVSCADYPTGNPSSCGKKIKIGDSYFPDLIRETAYYALRNELEHHPALIKPYSGVLADYETWSQTPASQQKDPLLYICKTDQLAAKYHLFLVQSPFAKTIGERVKEEVEAARCAAKYGANEVTELQYQGRELDPKAYKGYISAAVKAIHAVAKNARIMGGLAIDLDGKRVKSICAVIHSYFATKSLLSGYWLNGSSPASLGVQFFEYIGAIPGNAGFSC
jgi:hypothetical protein